MTAEIAAAAPDAVAGSEVAPKRRAGVLLGVGVFAGLTAAFTFAAYHFGDGVVFIGERTISDMTFFEVTGASAMGVAGVAVGLTAAGLALAAALIAGLISIVVAVLGLGLGLFVTLGFVMGPVLLAVIVGILVKRRYWPDVI
jgi:hypothetical protein